MQPSTVLHAPGEWPWITDPDTRAALSGNGQNVPTGVATGAEKVNAPTPFYVAWSPNYSSVELSAPTDGSQGPVAINVDGVLAPASAVDPDTVFAGLVVTEFLVDRHFDPMYMAMTNSVTGWPIQYAPDIAISNYRQYRAAGQGVSDALQHVYQDALNGVGSPNWTVGQLARLQKNVAVHAQNEADALSQLGPGPSQPWIGQMNATVSSFDPATWTQQTAVGAGISPNSSSPHLLLAQHLFSLVGKSGGGIPAMASGGGVATLALAAGGGLLYFLSKRKGKGKRR